MAKFERLEPRAEDMPVFDGSVDEEEVEEGSRLPLLIVIALLVLAAFAGVVYLAYTQGVERGRADAPRVIVAQASGTKLKVYQQPAPTDEESEEPANADSVPAPPTAKAPSTPPNAAPAEQTPPVAQMSAELPPVAAPTPKPASPPSATATEATAPAQTAPSPKKVTSVAPAAIAPQVATQAPQPLVAPSESRTASVSPPAKPQATDTQAGPAATDTPAKPQAGNTQLQIGSYKSQDEADAAWNAFKGKYPAVDGYTSNVKQVDLGAKGTWYRLRIGPFADKDAATTFCTKLKADGASCLLAR